MFDSTFLQAKNEWTVMVTEYEKIRKNISWQKANVCLEINDVQCETLILCADGFSFEWRGRAPSHRDQPSKKPPDRGIVAEWLSSW